METLADIPVASSRDEQPAAASTSGGSAASWPLSSVLVVDDEPGMCNFLQKILAPRFALVETAADVAAAEVLQQRCHFDLIISDIRLPGRSGVEWLQALREQGDNACAIFITAHADLDTAIAALRAGAADFILKPFRAEQILAAVERCMDQLRLARENFVLRRQEARIYEGHDLIGESAVIREVDEIIRRVAPMPSTVLVEGESGTGKELAARAIHGHSGRGGSFVPINCGAISPELLESELFGHARGAFTGAHRARDGLFTYADSGTLFLDEIGEMPLAMQAKLLRVLEDRVIRPVGANREIPVDVRIIAATNRDLGDEVAAGRFREDLYYRLNVLTIRMPSLRERPEDLPVLAQHFLATLAAELGIARPSYGALELGALAGYHWPGNVREFKNVMERSLLLGRAPAQCLGLHEPAARSAAAPVAAPQRLEDVERRHILGVLDEAGGNKSEAARRLGIARKTLERKLRAWQDERAGAAAGPS